jgi:hypothetical protein
MPSNVGPDGRLNPTVQAVWLMRNSPLGNTY